MMENAFRFSSFFRTSMIAAGTILALGACNKLGLEGPRTVPEGGALMGPRRPPPKNMQMMQNGAPQSMPQQAMAAGYAAMSPYAGGGSVWSADGGWVDGMPPAVAAPQTAPTTIQMPSTPPPMPQPQQMASFAPTQQAPSMQGYPTMPQPPMAPIAADSYRHLPQQPDHAPQQFASLAPAANSPQPFQTAAMMPPHMAMPSYAAPQPMAAPGQPPHAMAEIPAHFRHMPPELTQPQGMEQPEPPHAELQRQAYLTPPQGYPQAQPMMNYGAQAPDYYSQEMRPVNYQQQDSYSWHVASLDPQMPPMQYAQPEETPVMAAPYYDVDQEHLAALTPPQELEPAVAVEPVLEDLPAPQHIAKPPAVEAVPEEMDRAIAALGEMEYPEAPSQPAQSAPPRYAYNGEHRYGNIQLNPPSGFQEAYLPSSRYASPRRSYY